MHTKAILLTASGIGVVGVGGAGAYYLFSPSEPKNIKEKLIKDGIALVNTNDEYEVSFKELKETEAFITALKTKTSDIEKSKNLQEGAKALKKWCEENWKLELSETNTKDILPKVKDYCQKLPLTIAEKIAKNKKKLVSDWKTKLKDLNSTTGTDGAKKDPELGAALGVSNLDSANEDEVSEKLKEWCNDKVKTKINADADNAIWNQVEKRCVATQ